MSEVLEPFNNLTGMAEDFVEQYGAFFSIVKNVKEAYNILKEG